MFIEDNSTTIAHISLIEKQAARIGPCIAIIKITNILISEFADVVFFNSDRARRNLLVISNYDNILSHILQEYCIHPSLRSFVYDYNLEHLLFDSELFDNSLYRHDPHWARVSTIVKMTSYF